MHRVPGPAQEVAAELGARGWDVARVPAAASEDELWEGVSEALDLPAWFGRNLDALDEVIADLSRPTALVLARWTTYARAHPERWRALLEVLGNRAGQPDPALVVMLTD